MNARSDSRPTDRELLARAQSGNADAFGTLFERHGPTVLQFCFRRTADAAVAEDLTSIVFLEAWRKRAKLELFQESARPWLLGVALNVIRSQRRTQRRHADALSRVPAAESPEPESERAIARIDAERQMRVLLETVSKLNRREREVLELCVWAELSTEEAAQTLGVSVGAVRSRLSRARRRLAVLAPAVQSSATTA
jgi:RNA polymerase sigma-70 factor (ECF subfamily)